jgi:uncharacterized membrane protein
MSLIRGAFKLLGGLGLLAACSALILIVGLYALFLVPNPVHSPTRR